mgnify:CR=1 FL=1|jgi:hypothetical protein
MADAKISALTNLTAADAINDMIPIVDVSDTPPASGNTKRISINNILSSSPTASGALTVTGLVTAGSATITGDLTVRSGNKLILNRADNAISTQLNDAGGSAGFTVNNLNGDGIRLQLAGTTIYSSTSTATQTWNISGTTAMTLNSTGLGIGIVGNSNSKLSVYGTGDQIDEAATLSVGNTAVGGMRLYAGVNNTNEYVYIGSVKSGTGYRSLILQPNGGNVGVGVTPSAWSATFRSLDIGSGTLTSQPSQQTIGLYANAFENGTNYTRKALGTAAGYNIYNGAHYWLNAVSGAAASTFSFGDAKMTLDASGNLLVGTTTLGARNTNIFSKSAGFALEVQQRVATTGGSGLGITYSVATPNNGSDYFQYCADASAVRLYITSNGGIANYQANNANLSDARTKTDIKPLASYWDKIKALELVTFKYKDQTHSDDNIGLIAQQVESVAPELIDVDGFGETPEDGVPLKTIYTTDLYHAAIKALQEAMTRIEALEAKLA